MFSFEGDFRRKPIQSLRGTSQKEPRESLIKKAQDKRQRREDDRRKQLGAVKIQSYFRSYVCRKKQMRYFRQEFDNLKKSLEKVETIESTTLHDLFCKLFLFFSHEDCKRLTFLFQHLLKKGIDYIIDIDNKYGNGLYHLNKILHLCLKYLVMISDKSEPIALPMRLLEIFTSSKLYENVKISGSQSAYSHIMNNIIKSGYYSCLRSLLDNKVPSSIEWSSTPPTPVAGSLIDLIMKPIRFVSKTSEKELRKTILRSICETFFSPPFSEQIEFFIIPALSSGKDVFPFEELVDGLISLEKEADNKCTVIYYLTPTPYLLSSLLTLSQNYIGVIKNDVLFKYIKLLDILLPVLMPDNSHNEDIDDAGSDNEMEEDMIIDVDKDTTSLMLLKEEVLRQLDSVNHIKCFMNCLYTNDYNDDVVECICNICYRLLVTKHASIHKMRLLYSLAFNTKFVRKLWQMCSNVSLITCTGSKMTLLSMLGRGLLLNEEDRNRIVSLLYVFAAMFSHSLFTLHDDDFYGDEQSQFSSMPFTISELIPMSLALREVCLGIVELAHPDTKIIMNDDYQYALHKTSEEKRNANRNHEIEMRFVWASLFKVISNLVRQLHDRDTRRPFCPAFHWLATNVSIQPERLSQIYQRNNSLFTKRSLGLLSSLCKTSYDSEGPPLANRDVRNIVILTELPFVVSFTDRVQILQRLIQSDKEENQGEMTNFVLGPAINVVIRRNYIYEDAFEKLSPENEPNLKLKMRVQLKNAAGLDEAGIDGGGVFREFLTVLLKTSFDPNRGFFQYTTDRLLYPNPHAANLEENYTQHYYFIGRLLGKAIYENMLVEIPFASFFLAKILSRHGFNLDIHYLQSLDPVMYKNLLSLKNYEKDVSELGLDFTVVDNSFGETKIIELKPGGKNVPVDNQNKIEYVHLMADYKVNKQIRSHCSAFRQGMADVINLEWLQMFNHQELQILISGSSKPVDVVDLRRHTNYSGGFSETHPVIELFWKVVDSFSEQQKSQLLKFVTSCSQQPLLGFKDLYPPFCIHDAGPDLERLPTASTCMNLLKLPHFKDASTLKSKLLYAIESNAGFELS